MAIENLTEEDAAIIFEHVRERLPARDYLLGLALADVLELPIPKDVDPLALEHEVWKIGFGLIAESFGEDYS